GAGAVRRARGRCAAARRAAGRRDAARVPGLPPGPLRAAPGAPGLPPLPHRGGRVLPRRGPPAGRRRDPGHRTRRPGAVLPARVAVTAVRHRMWTPLPPERSGIADYSFELLETMAGLADVSAVGRYPDEARTPAGVPLLAPDDVEDSGDAVDIYQMGNNTEFHEWIY